MEYIVKKTFRDRAQNFKIMKPGTVYPPRGADVSAEWLEYLAAFVDADGDLILEPVQKQRRVAKPAKAKKESGDAPQE